MDRACRPAREAPDVNSGSRIFMESWKAVADQVADQARASEAAGHLRTAGQQWYRSGLYVCQAERMLSNADPGRREFYQQALDAFEKVFELADPATSRVEVPFEGTTLPAYFSNASMDGSPAPCVIMWNGLDSTKEHMYTSGWPQEMRERGISVLMVDCPGSGEALRFQDLKARIETEGWAAACVDYLETRSDVDADRIGLAGWSLGGYYCPRAAAYEKRLKFVAVWGANHNWGEVQKERQQREGENPVPHYWEHVLWVWGFDDVDAFIEYAEGVHLNGVVEQITVPVPHRARRERPPDQRDVRPPVLRPGRQQPRARAAHLHGGGGGGGARRPRPHAAHQRVRGRLGRGPLRRAGMTAGARREGRPDHRDRRRPGGRRGGSSPRPAPPSSAATSRPPTAPRRST